MLQHMDKYNLRQPVMALRYQRNANEQTIVALVKQGGRRPSFDNQHGYLHIYNDGPELKVYEGSWVVALGGDVGVLSDEEFVQMFEPA
jgi:hypothetical protein